jgi:hypothetical protein
MGTSLPAGASAVVHGTPPSGRSAGGEAHGIGGPSPTALRPGAQPPYKQRGLPFLRSRAGCGASAPAQPARVEQPTAKEPEKKSPASPSADAPGGSRSASDSEGITSAPPTPQRGDKSNRGAPSAAGAKPTGLRWPACTRLPARRTSIPAHSGAAEHASLSEASLMRRSLGQLAALGVPDPS